MIVPGMFVCSNFLISVWDVYCVERFSHFKCFSDYSRRGAIWMTPFGTVLFDMCSTVICGIILLRAVLNMLVKNASRRGPMGFMSLMFSFSGLWELLFILCFIASWTCFVVRVLLYPYI